MKEFVVDLDDFHDENHRLDLLHKLKERVPEFKATLFVIPGFSTPEFLEKVNALDWLQLALHGEYHHRFECRKWDARKINEVLDRYEPWGVFQKIFKAPNCVGNSEIYRELEKRDYILAERRYVPYNDRLYLPISAACIHGHIQNVCGNGLEEKFEFYSSLRGTFKFISELF